MKGKLIAGIILLPCLLAAQITPTPASERITGATLHRQMQDSSIIKNLRFESIGPTIFSGRVADIDVDPDDPSHFYVAYASGGLWYTDNLGTSFTPCFDHEAVMTIGDIAVNWKDSLIWVGTGENNSSRSSYSGVGMYRSADGGKTWEHRGLDESQHIGRIVLDPNDPNTLWVAVLGSLYSSNPARGVYKTTDGGLTWRQTLAINDTTGAIDLVQSPDNPQVLFAATWERTRRAWNFVESGSGSGIYRSDDGGENWQCMTTAESGFPTGEGTGRIGLAAADTPEGYLLYAILDNYNRRPPEPQKPGILTKAILRDMNAEDFLKLDTADIAQFLEDNGFPEKYTADTILQLVSLGTIKPATLVTYLEDANTLLFDTEVIGAEVYVSADEGRHWHKTHEDYLNQLYYSYGYYFGQIRVSPSNPQKLYILGVPMLTSDNGGATWKAVNGDNVHGDHHALWVSGQRDGLLILGNDGGINITYDDGAHWIKCNSPAVGQFYSVQTDRATPYNVYGGLQDNGVWGGPNTYRGGTRWHSSGKYPYQFISGGDGMQVQVDFRDNNTVYSGFQFGNYFRTDKTTGKQEYITPRHELTERPYRWNWQAPVWLSRHQQDILYMGSQYVHRSLDQGRHFELISGDLTKGGRKGDVPYGTLTTIHESPLEFGVLYAGSDDGLIHVTRDFGTTWTRISDALPQDMWVSRVRASAHVPSRVYCTLNGYRWDHFDAYVYVSENYGESWKRIGLNLPEEPVNVLIEDPVNANILYVGTDGGLYISLDRGQTFLCAGLSLPSVPVHDLDIQPEAKDLLVGTHGRSFYKADISQLELLTTDLLSEELHVFALPASGMRASSRWGMRQADWAEYQLPEISIPFYSKSAGEVTLEILYQEIPVFHTTSMAEKGLNFMEYDLSVSPSYDKAYSDAYLKEHPDAKPEVADNGTMYLKKGSYAVILTRRRTSKRTGFELK